MPLRPRDDLPELDLPELLEDDRDVEDLLLELDFRELTPDDLEDDDDLLETPDDREDELGLDDVLVDLEEDPELREYPGDEDEEPGRVVARLEEPFVVVVELRGTYLPEDPLLPELVEDLVVVVPDDVRVDDRGMYAPEERLLVPRVVVVREPDSDEEPRYVERPMVLLLVPELERVTPARLLDVVDRPTPAFEEPAPEVVPPRTTVREAGYGSAPLVPVLDVELPLV